MFEDEDDHVSLFWRDHEADGTAEGEGEEGGTG